MGLSPLLLESLEDMGFNNASPIQELTLDPILSNKDVFAQAETGSGKTGAFVIPIIEKILRKLESDTEANLKMSFVVLSPTRELAQQTQSVFDKLGAKANISTVCLIGGESIEKQKKVLESGAQVLVATPGRLCDLIKQKCVNLSECQVMVFDEADRLFDMGFQKDVEFILGRTSKHRQLIMLSATTNQEVLRTAYKFNSDPEELKLNSDNLIVDNIDNKLAMISSEEKFPFLVNLLRKKEDAYAIVFCNTQVQTHTVAEWLIKMNFKAKPISSRLSQNKRTKLLEDFREKKVTILVCTDVAARGLDIKKVNLVVNYDLPQEAASYVHRIGRTARAGEDGEAISFCAFEDCEFLDPIKELIEHDIERMDIEESDFATDICKKPRIERKTLKLIDNSSSRNTKKERVNMNRENTRTERPKRAPRENKAQDKKPYTQAPRIDRRFIEKETFDIETLTNELLAFFRIEDKDLIDHEIISQGPKKYILFGARKTKYKFFVKPIFKKLLLPFLINIIKKSGLNLIVKVSYRPNSLMITFSGKDQSFLGENHGELLKSFEQFIMIYLQSRIVLDRNLKIIVKGGNTKVERVNNKDRKSNDKELERKLNHIAKTQRKKLIETQESVLLKPLNANERRIIHQFFQNDEQVKTSSVGDGHLKQVELSLK